MAALKNLAKDTALYGISSIVGRFLNWLLVPLYTYNLVVEEFSEVTNLYAWMAILLVILTYGLETGYFRFASQKEEDPQRILSSCMTSLLVTSSLFILLISLFLTPISNALEYSADPNYILILSIIIAIDAFTSLPFAHLRFQRKAIRFVSIKMGSIAINIGLNLFFILLCPQIYKHHPETISWFYNPNYGVGYILVSNLISSLFVLLALIPQYTSFRWHFDFKLLKRILHYSLPLLILGIAGIMNQTIDKILLPLLIENQELAKTELGIYGANFKIAIVMVMFIQAFRYAFEPFIFSQDGDKGKDVLFADAMKYFVLLSLLIFLGVMFYIDILKYFVGPKYFSGLDIVPIVMLAQIFNGIYFNLSLWYKLSNRTQWGAYLSLLGLVFTLVINIVFVPKYGYVACAWAAFFCYLTMAIASYLVGRYYYPIPYEIRRISIYIVSTLVVYLIGIHIEFTSLPLTLGLRTTLLAAYAALVIHFDQTLKQLLISLLKRIKR